jgi:hypothetical protein
MRVSLFPDKVFELIRFEKVNQTLELYGTLKVLQETSDFKYIIDCVNNTFEFEVSNTQYSLESVNRANRSDAAFYFQSDCDKCDATYANANDLEFDFSTKTINNVGIEREGVWLYKNNPYYHLQFSYFDNEMLIYKHIAKKEFSSDDEDMGNAIHLPIVDFDFTNQEKVIKRIQTLLVFN